MRMESSSSLDAHGFSTTARSSECDDADERIAVDLSYVEFYSGIGGWTMALEEAINRIPEFNFSLRRIAALDHSDLCTRVFEHNFGSDSKSYSIERLTHSQLEEWNVDMWFMSPPCQPHTRQHSNQEEDLDDPRSASFLHLIGLIRTMKESRMPSLLFLENVVGFESSRSFQLWVEALEQRQYKFWSFQLTPTQVGLPNDRPRYFCLALRTDRMMDEASLGSLKAYRNSESSAVLKGIPELGVKFEADVDEMDLPRLSVFLDKSTDSKGLSMPQKSLRGNTGWSLDIVTPLNRRTSCFTSGYGRYNRGTGSVLYDDETREFQLLEPEKREFDENWSRALDFSKLRYFSGAEMALLMGFSSDFSFPTGFTPKQQWKLIGNSLNVRVASKVVELGLRLIKFRSVAAADYQG